MKFYLPKTLNEMWNILLAAPESDIYAGGTDFLVHVRIKGKMPASVICIERIEELSVVKDFPGEIFIGAGTTHAAIMSNTVIRDNFPVLAKAVSQIGSPQIRNMGTIGGNIVSASPAGDSLPPLYVLDAEVEIRNHTGETRRIPVSDFIRGPGRTSLCSGEILYGIWIKKKSCFTVHYFEKVGKRKALAISIVSMACCIGFSDKQTIDKIRFAWGSAGPVVMTVPEAEKCLHGASIDDISRFSEAAEYVRRNIAPIDDVRASAAYRRKTAGNLVLRLSCLNGREDVKGKGR